MEELVISYNYKDSLISILIIGIVMIIVVPLSSVLLDILIILNISIALVILLTTLYIGNPLEFSSFPTLLLVTTLFRLSLNISSTRLILGDNGNAGKVIETFGNFVIKGDPVVGLIIFLIIIVVQFIVITKGSERVSEVTARFTLDAMPGKQMAIDADLNSGLIDEKQAKERRENIQGEANFYGAMDGATKFVKGDAIAGIIITLINLIGGVVIGIVMSKKGISEVLQIYTLATVGDGLVSQIPALLISTATGIILTRSTSKGNLNQEILGQMFSMYIVLFIGGTTLLAFTFIPGLPKAPLIVIGSLFLFLGYRLYSEDHQTEDVPVKVTKPPVEEQKITDYIFSDPIVVEFGYNLVPLVDRNKGGKLLDRMAMIRRQCATEMGMIIPQIRVKDNPTLMPSQYSVKIKESSVAMGEILIDYLLAMDSGEGNGKIDGIETVEPAFGMPAIWIKPENVEIAEIQGYTIVDPVSVIATHLSEIIKNYSHELLGRQEVKTLVEALEEKYPALVGDIIPEIVNLSTLQKVLCNLLEENIKIKNLPTILEILGDYARTINNIDELTEYVRQGLKREICEKYSNNNQLEVILISPEIEQKMTEKIINHNSRADLIKPEEIKLFINNLIEEYKQAMNQGYRPIVITTAILRRYMKSLVKQRESGIDVLSVSEIDNKYDIKVVGNVSI